MNRSGTLSSRRTEPLADSPFPSHSVELELSAAAYRIMPMSSRSMSLSRSTFSAAEIAMSVFDSLPARRTVSKPNDLRVSADPRSNPRRSSSPTVAIRAGRYSAIE